MWARFESLEDFNIWHDEIKAILGIPLPDGITTEYTTAHLMSDGSYSAWVEEIHADGLIPGDAYVAEKIWS